MTIPGSGKHIDESERAILAALVARPDLSAGQVVNLFRSKAGRPICKTTVQRRRKAGPYAAPGGHNHLLRGERAVLDRLIREAEGQVGYRELAEQFLALAGRPIDVSAVWHRAIKLGVPRVGRGRRRPKLRRSSIEARIGQAHEDREAAESGSKAKARGGRR
jgi:hypothetical protein